MTKLEELKLAWDRAAEEWNRSVEEWGKAEEVWGKARDAYWVEQNKKA